jgi:photosystem II stability/assembly factor-like uncharacterized protein
MKPLFITAFTILAYCTIAQPSTYPDIEYSTLTRMDVQGDVIAAYGTCDIMYLSTDRGTTWSIINNLSHNINDIAILARRGSMLVASTQGILELDYQGNIIDNHLETALNEVEADATHIYANMQGVIYEARTSDLVFTEVAADTLSINFAIMELTDNYLYAAAWDGRLLKVDRSTHQIQVMHSLGGRVGALSMTDDNNGYLVPPSRTEVLHTTDGWKTFSAARGFPEAINPICSGDTVLTINTNRIYRSTDAGETSERVTTANSREFVLTSDAQFDHQGRLYVIGRANMIGYSDDLGDTFTFFDPYNRSNLYDIDLNTPGVGWAVGAWNTLLHTTDNGVSWTDQDLEIGMQDVLWHVATLPDGTALVASSRELIHLSSTDIISRQDRAMIEDMYYDEATETIIIGQRGSSGSDIMISTDNGATWLSVLSTSIEYPIISRSYDGSINVAGGTEVYYTSTDLGATWEEVTTNLERIVRISRINDQEVLALEYGKIYKSNDGGQSFLQLASGYAIRDVVVVDEDTYFYTTRTSNTTALRVTEDGGQTWTIQHRNCIATNDFEVTSDGRVLMAQDYGHINTYQMPMPTDIKEVLFAELSIYPNPVSSGQTIHLGESVASVRVYDLNGRHISHDLYTNKLTINAEPGLYIVEASTASGQRSITKLVVQ